MSPFDPIPTALLRPGADLRAEVAARAGALLAATQRAHPEAAPPPFDPEAMARVLGIPVTRSVLADCDALLVPRGGRFHIVLNSRVRSPGRVRYSLAHEIAHTFFDDAGAALRRRAHRRERDGSGEDAVLERLCDAGAAELLMPSSFFLAALAELGPCACSVPELAHRFAVSGEAAALRFLELAPEVCAIGFFHYTRRPAHPLEVPAYRVRRVFHAAQTPFLFPEGKSVPPSSVIYRASLAAACATAVETFALSRVQAQFEVSAYPLLPDAMVVPEAPPAVCAVFRRPVRTEESAASPLGR